MLRIGYMSVVNPVIAVLRRTAKEMNGNNTDLDCCEPTRMLIVDEISESFFGVGH